MLGVRAPCHRQAIRQTTVVWQGRQLMVVIRKCHIWADQCASAVRVCRLSSRRPQAQPEVEALWRRSFPTLLCLPERCPIFARFKSLQLCDKVARCPLWRDRGHNKSICGDEGQAKQRSWKESQAAAHSVGRIACQAAFLNGSARWICTPNRRNSRPSVRAERTIMCWYF